MSPLPTKKVHKNHSFLPLRGQFKPLKQLFESLTSVLSHIQGKKQLTLFSRIVFCLLPPATKLGQGYIFTSVCDSVHRGGGAWSGGVWSWGVHGAGEVWSGGLVPCFLVQGGTWWRPPKTATAARGTHPTRMHSCLMCRFHNNFMM